MCIQRGVNGNVFYRRRRSEGNGMASRRRRSENKRKNQQRRKKKKKKAKNKINDMKKHGAVAATGISNGIIWQRKREKLAKINKMKHQRNISGGADAYVQLPGSSNGMKTAAMAWRQHQRSGRRSK